MDIRDLKNNDNKHMPSIIWDWCAKPTPEEIDSKLKSFSDIGIARVFLRVSGALVIPYLSDEYFELVRTSARRCAKYNIELWIFDENSSSSGNGGGEITSVSDYCLREFTLTNRPNTDDSVIDEKSVLRDKSRHFGREYLPISDITDEFITECFTESVYNKYLEECKRFIGYEITGFVSGINLPDNSIFYSASAHNKLNDENITISALSEVLLSEDEKHYKLKNDYYNAFSFLTSSSFTSKLADKCHANNLKLSCGVNGAYYISRQCMYMLSDMPYVTVDADNFDLTQIKLLTSVCEQFKKPSLAFLKSTAFSSSASRYSAAMKLSTMGINEVCYDSALFSLSDRGKHEEFITVLSAFCEKDISSRVSRALNIVNETSYNADVLLLYPSSYMNALHSSDTKKEMEYYLKFKNIVSSLTKDGVAFHIADEYMLSSYGAVSGDEIRIGNSHYSTLLIPDCDFLDEKTLSIIESFKPHCALTGASTLFSDVDVFNAPKNADFNISCDKDLFVNYRSDEESHYAFITALDDCTVSVDASDDKLFIIDISCGEIYEYREDSLSLTKGKTVVLVSSSHLFADITPPLFDGIQLKPFSASEGVPFALSSAEENILALKEANVCLGKKSYINANIDDLHKEFYALADGETVKVKYPFFAQSDALGSISLYIENALAIDCVLINGKVLSDIKESDIDKNFCSFDITDYISIGKNVISLDYKKFNHYSPMGIKRKPAYHFAYAQTSLEAVYLVGDFDVIDNKLCSTTEHSGDCASYMPDYYGPLTYLAKLPDSTLHKVLSLDGNFDVCSIQIGKRRETFFTNKPIMELFDLDCGKVAEITIYNTPHNLFRYYKESPKPFGIEAVNIYET